MFKNSKEKENKYIRTQEMENMYEFQKKNFDEKIEKQQEKINGLIDYISARFGEEVLETDIGTKIKKFEESLKTIEKNYKVNLEKNEKELKKEIEKEAKKIAAELNDAQTEAYFKLLKKNENDITKIQEIFDKQEENDEIIANLDKIVKAHINESETYRKELQDKLKNTNKKIEKISYAGVTSKFDKRIKEECAILDEKIEEIKNQNTISITNLDEQFLQKLGQVQEHFQINGNEIIKLQEMFMTENEKINSVLESNINRVVVLDERLSEEVESIDEDIKKIEDKTNKLDNEVTGQIEEIKGIMQTTENTVKNLDKKLSSEFESINDRVKKTEKFVNGLDEMLNNEKQEFDVILKNIEVETSKLDEKFAKKIEKITISSKNNDVGISKLDKKLIKEVEKLNEKIQNNINEVTGLEQKIIEQINIANNNEPINSLEEKISNEMIKISENNENMITQLKEDCTNKIIQTREAINKLKDIAKNKNIKIEEKIKLTNEDLKTIEVNLLAKIESLNTETKEIYTKLTDNTNLIIDAKIQNVTENIEASSKIELSTLENKVNNSLKHNKKYFVEETQKLKAEINEQIINTHNENKVELENISENVEDIRSYITETIEVIGADVLKLKKEIKQSLENQNNVDVEDLKKDYNKYVTKINNELAKIGKDLLNAQKKNQEQNKNLQVKIKAYIDAKIDKSNNIGNVENLINELSLSIVEREKLHKIEMEELLNKKLKTIQKDNDRIIEEKIEEMFRLFNRENKTKTTIKPNTVSLYEDIPTQKKSMYNIIDDKQILKRSAARKKSSLPLEENQSQILKFFYDNEDDV